MRHKRAGKLFGRTANQRKALLRGLLSSLFLQERIETTVTKAKETRKLAERLITLGIRGDVASRRVALSDLPDKPALAKLFKTIGPRLQGRNGGYLRIVQTRRRVNDSAPMAVLEFVDFEAERAKKPPKPEKKPKKEGKEKEKEK
jgi:large subunit ribosomal protein L17